MKHNLMGKEKIENLGYSEVNTFENEEAVSLNILLIFVEKKSTV